MKINANFTSILIDIEKTKELYHQYMMEKLTQVAFAWVNAAEAVVPVWTGASKATFLQLAHAVGFTITIVSSPTAPADATGLGKAQSEGRLGPVDPDKGQYFFTYSTTLDHLIENEQINANTALGLHLKHPGPYHFQELGQAAFEKEAKDTRLPPPVLLTKRIQ